jgi:hypothetical protein
MPNAATFETIRNAVYFPDAQHLEPLLVQAVWLIGTLTAFLLAARVTGRLPAAGQPATGTPSFGAASTAPEPRARRLWLRHHR